MEKWCHFQQLENDYGHSNLKKWKDGLDPTHYRSISLTCCLCKLMERMVCRSLQWYLGRENAIDTKRFGFRKRHFTVDLLLRVEHDINQAFSRGRMVLVVSFDLENAYDTTWKWGIPDSMHKMGPRGRLPRFIANFLKNIKFRVQVGKLFSPKNKH